jgi:branched-chain amino acid transport system substrate-binding protein
MIRIKLVGLASLMALTAVLVGASASGAATNSSATKSPYDVGFVSSLSGAVAFLGLPQEAGFETYIDATNAAGGVDGHKVVAKVEDDQFSTGPGVIAVRGFVSDGVKAIVGPYSSDIIPVAYKVSEAAKIPMLSLTGVSSLVSPRAPYYYAGGELYSDAAAVQYKFMQGLEAKNHTTYTRFSDVVFDDVAFAAFDSDLRQQVPAHKNGKLGSVVYVPVGVSNVAAQVSSLMSQNPQVIFSGVNSPSLILLDRGLRAAGYKGVIIQSDGIDQPTVNELKDPNLYIQRAYVDPSDTSIPAVATMVAQAKKYGQTKNMTNENFTAGYVSGEIIVDAMKKVCATDCTAAQVNTALSDLTVKTAGLTGPAATSPGNGNNLFFRANQTYTYANGKVVPVGTWVSPG